MKKVNEIKLLNKKYILKFIDLPMTYFELIDQHKFINYLRKGGLLTPKLYFSKFLSIFKIELQEYVSNSNEICSEREKIIFLAKFHDMSYMYNKTFKKKKYYVINQECNNIMLDKILIGFKEKYYLFPIKEVNNKKLKQLYMFFYNEFISKYYNDDCIIHNDISIYNMYSHNDDLCIIDFDFSTKGSIYVDFVDLIIKRTYNINEICDKMLQKNNLKKLINEYNQTSINFHLEYKGCLLMIGLKVLAYNFFVLSKINSKDIFKNNLFEIEGMLKILKGEYNGN